MSKQTLALIVSLLVVTVVLVILAVMPQQPTSPIQPVLQPSPTPYAHSVLSLSPNPVVISSPSGSVDIKIDSGINDVTGVQVEIGYDPLKLTAVKVTPGTFFDKSNVLINNIDTKNGRISYALVIPLDGTPKKGSGTVATISFRSLLTPGEQTALTFMPKTLVTASQVRQSVLLNKTSTTVMYTAPGVQTSPVYNTPASPTQ